MYLTDRLRQQETSPLRYFAFPLRADTATGFVNMATGIAYEHLRPEQKEIRLLYFTRAECNPHVRLACTIKTVSLLDDPAPRYYAVSYTWGDATWKRYMNIDGRTAGVPQNAEIALRYLHRYALQSDGGASAGVWLDAICIDQSNKTEKADQIWLMGELYSTAQEVLIWLGEDKSSLPQRAVATIT